MMRDFGKQCTLGEISSIQTGPFGSQLHASDYKNTGTPIITVEHIGENKVLHRNLPLVGQMDRERLGAYDLQAGDVVFSRVGAIDRRAYVSEKEHGWLFSGRLLRVRPVRGVVDPRFLSHLLGQYKSIQWIRSRAVGSTMACLNTKILAAVPILLPPKPEQCAIREVLDTLDEVINKSEQLVAKLRQMKQGLLHDLLTRGIDENGELRDPDRHPEQFKDSPLGMMPKVWSVLSLGEVVPHVVYGVSVPLGFDSSGVPVLRMNNLKDGEADVSDLKYSGSAVARRLLLRPGDVLFNRTNSIEHVGRTGIWRGQLGLASFASYLVRLEPEPVRLNNEFLNCWLNWPCTQVRIRRYATPGVQQVNINPTNLRKTVIALPRSIPEQVAIVESLAAYDATVASEVRELSKLRLLKQGLMDDLLTGRVRVTPLDAESTP